MSEVIVSRTRSVLELAHKTEGEVRFGSLVEGKGDRVELDHSRPTVMLSAEQWTELGEPDAVTVAIWPGDRQDLMEGDPEQAQEQIDKLASFILSFMDGEPSQSEGAVDTAIRLLDKARRKEAHEVVRLKTALVRVMEDAHFREACPDLNQKLIPVLKGADFE